jgi:leucyl aminopeptidase (aminopeptidase T)
MEFTIGTEGRNEYMDFELGRAAHKLVTEIRPIKAGDEVLITGDTGSDARVIQAVARAVYAVGGTPSVMWHPMLPEPMMEPPRPVAKAITGAKVWMDFNVNYLLYSPAFYEAMQGGTVYFSLTGMDVDMMVRTIGLPDYGPLTQMARVLYEESQKAQVIRVTNPAGTDFTVKVDQDFFDPPWQPEDQPGGFAQMLGGQSWFNVNRESTEGILVFDGVIWPPKDIGVLRSPVKLTFEKGYIRNIEGGQEAKIFSRWLASFNHPNVYLLDHACYGFNPGVRRLSGRIVEDERLFGCIQFGIGATPKRYGSPAHTDGVVMNPSIWWDGVQIEDEGRYIHPQLVELCQAMGAAGY